MRRNALMLIFFGFLAALSCWSLLLGVGLVQEAFATSLLLGWVTLLSISMIVVGVGYLCFTEIAGYWSIRKVDKLAAALTSEDVDVAKRLSLHWLHSISSTHCIEQQLLEVHKAQSVEEIHQSISTIVCLIDAKVDRLIATESLLIGAAVGISPWPVIDGAIVAWRQLRLMRTIATRYGARPSAIGTFRLLRRVLVTVVLADASEHATQWIASKIPSLGGLIPAAGQAVAIIVLTVRLGRACKSTCRPIAREVATEPKTFAKIREYVSQTFQQCRKHAAD